MSVFKCVAVLFALGGLVGCSHPNPSISPHEDARPLATTANANLTQLFSRAWRVSPSPYGPAAGSIYVFLPNGTLLETSCVETYRVATWTADPANQQTLQIVEDARPAFTAVFTTDNEQTIHMKQTLLLGTREQKDFTLTGVDKEFVCPDMKK